MDIDELKAFDRRYYELVNKRDLIACFELCVSNLARATEDLRIKIGVSSRLLAGDFIERNIMANASIDYQSLVNLTGEGSR